MFVLFQNIMKRLLQRKTKKKRTTFTFPHEILKQIFAFNGNWKYFSNTNQIRCLKKIIHFVVSHRPTINTYIVPSLGTEIIYCHYCFYPVNFAKKKKRYMITLNYDSYVFSALTCLCFCFVFQIENLLGSQKK